MCDLLDSYYERLLEVLNATEVDTSTFNKINFAEELERMAKNDLFRTLFTLKIFTLEVTEDVDMNDIKTSIFLGPNANKAYYDRVWEVLSIYIQNNWL